MENGPRRGRFFCAVSSDPRLFSRNGLRRFLTAEMLAIQT